jgi:hypothetical protein
MHGFDQGARGSFQGAVDVGLGPVGVLLHRGRRQPRAGRADDVGLDDHVVGAADQEQVLHVVAPEQDELALPVEIVDVDDAEPRLPAAAALVRGKRQAAAGQAAQHQGEEREKKENNREGNHVFDRRGQGFGARDR